MADEPNAVLDYLFRESVLQTVESVTSDVVVNEKAADF